MAASNLVSQERVKTGLSAAGSADDRLLDVLIASVSQAVEKWCRRRFALAAYDEFPAPCPDGRLLLRRFPVQSVDCVRHSPTAVLSVRNTDTATNQIARVTVTETGLELLRVASGVRTLNSLAFSSYPTISQIATAVSGLGSGWSAQVVGSATGDYGLWPGADLYIPPASGDAVRSAGALSCRGTEALLRLHVGECRNYTWDARGWLDVAHEILIVSWHCHYLAPYRVQYTAGYADIPEDVQEACCHWVRELWYRAARDPLLHSTSSNTLSTTGSASGISTSYLPTSVMNTGGTGQSSLVPDTVKALLAPYCVRNI